MRILPLSTSLIPLLAVAFLLHEFIASASAAGEPARRSLPPEARPYDNSKMRLDTVVLGAENRAESQPADTLFMLDATCNESISLHEALTAAVRYNLPIKISRENWYFQRYQLGAYMSAALPTYSAQYSYTRTKVKPITRASARLFISELRFPVFQGGDVFHNSLGQYYRNLAWKRYHEGTISDTLLQVFALYNNLCLQEALLRIQRKSVRLSEEFLRLDQAAYEGGASTQYSVLQSRMQLSADRENLAVQEAERRKAALALSNVLNLPQGSNLVPQESMLQVVKLIKNDWSIDQCIDAALKNRSELRQFELFQLAAARGVQAAAASLYPQLTFFTAYTEARDFVTPSGNGDFLNGIASGQVAAAQESQTSVVTNTALNQTASLSPEGSNSGVDGANTYATVVAGGGGTPIANVQGGGLVTSGAVKPTFGASSVTGKTTASNISGADTASAGVFPGISQNYQRGVNLSLTLPNLGVGTIGSVMSARSLSRQAMLQANQKLQLVLMQVHSAYSKMTYLKEQIGAAAMATGAAQDALNFSVQRVQAGLGINLDLLHARRDYNSALASQAQLIAALNQSQAQLLHDMGVVSVDSLTAGLNEPTGPKKRRTFEW